MRGSLRQLLIAASPPTRERISQFESAYELELPPAFRALVNQFGDLTAAKVPYRLLGLADDRTRRPTTASVLAELRSTFLDFPRDLLPVEVLPDGQVACIEVDGRPDPPVVLLDLESGPERAPAAPSYSMFCLDWLSDVQGMTAILDHTRRLDHEVETGRRPVNKAARPDEWHAYRFCSQDVVVGATLLRHNRDAHVTEVAALPCATLTALDEDAPIRGLLALVFAEAYRSGGDLSLRFVRSAGAAPIPTRVPGRVERFAAKNKVQISQPANGFVDPVAARSLFAESVTCPESLRQLLRDDVAGIDVAAVCFAIASGTWEPVVAEHLARNAQNPTRAFRGVATPLDAAAWNVDLRDASDGLLLGSLIRRAAAIASLGVLHDAEDEQRQIQTTFTDYGTAVVSSDDSLHVGWTWHATDTGTSRIEVLPVAADFDELLRRLPVLAAWLTQRAGADPCILVPRDAERLLDGTHDELVHAIDELGVDVLVAPLYTTTISADAGRRLDRARTSRQ